MIEVCVSCSFPEIKNSNNAIIKSIVEGFEDHLSEEKVLWSSFQTVANEVQRYKPKLLLLIGSPLLSVCDYHEISKACKKAGTLFVFWTFEDPYEFDANSKFTALADIVITNDLFCLDYYDRSDVYHLPMAASRSTKRLIANYDSRCLDVFFCGVGFENRQRLVNDAYPIFSKYKTRIYGANWKETPGQIINNTRIPSEDLFDFYSASKIVLNMGRNHSFANKKRSFTSVTPGPRTFEAAMVGCVQFYYQPSSALAEYFTPEEEIITFDDVDELAQKLESLLADNSMLETIASNAQQRCKQDHSYTKRAQQIFDICKL